MRISDWSSDVCSSDLDIGLRPAGEIEIGTGRQEFEACLGERGAFLAYQPLVELFLKAVQIAHIGCGIILLRIGQQRRAPVGRLLLLGDLNPKQIADEILQAVAIGVGADKDRKRTRMNSYK